MRQKVINFPRKKLKEVEKTKKRFRCLLPTDQQYELGIIFDKIHRSFVYCDRQNKHNYENVILGTNNEINAGKLPISDNISLHDYSRIFISGVGNNSSESLIKFMTQNSGYRFVKNYNLSQIRTELCVVFYEEANQEADHMGWYNIMEHDDHVTLSGMLFYKFSNIKDIHRFFQVQIELNLILTHIERHNIAIKLYPWNKSDISFFDNKFIFYLQ